MKITFYGATEGVTGSCYLVETKNSKFLVDCGMFQGDQENRKKNWQEPEFDVSSLDFIIVTHSHIDHIGRLPYLVKKGYKNSIYSTEPTKDFAEIFLLDTVGIQADEASDLGVDPLYDEKDVLKSIQLFRPSKYHEIINPKNGIEIEFFDAGHILGSAIIKIKADGKTIVFSGDLGNPPTLIVRDTEFIDYADLVVVESTYGDREHEDVLERKVKLERIIESTTAKNGTVLMPAFAMERTQEVLYELNELLRDNRIGKIPVYLDSPLAIKATEIYNHYHDYFDIEAKGEMTNGNNFLKFKQLDLVESVEESKKIDHTPGSKIIIAGSGMSTGGRILFHEKRYLSMPNTTLLIVGYQVKGTLGRKLLDGDKNVEILGEHIKVNARIESIESYSAHADQKKILYWLSKIKNLSKGEKSHYKKICIVHGEQDSKKALQSTIQDQLGCETVIPKSGESVEI
jgi:metallo-beta-lactamase family protein